MSQATAKKIRLLSAAVIALTAAACIIAAGSRVPSVRAAFIPFSSVHYMAAAVDLQPQADVSTSTLLKQTLPAESASSSMLTPIVIAGSRAPAPGHNYAVDPAARVPGISAISYLIGDVESGEVISSRYEQYQMPIASVSKLATALVALDLVPLTKPILITKSVVDTYGTAGELSVGQVLPASQLFYPLLLESSNDAAEAFAQAAGRDSFIRAMNDKVRSIGMTNTSYEDPSGLSPNNISTTGDLFSLTRYIAREKPILFEMSLERGHDYAGQHWHNISKFLGFSSYRGGKNGYTDEAGKTIITLWDVSFGAAGSREVAIILLDSKDNVKDVTSLLSYIDSAVTYDTARPDPIR